MGWKDKKESYMANDKLRTRVGFVVGFVLVMTMLVSVGFTLGWYN